MNGERRFRDDVVVALTRRLRRSGDADGRALEAARRKRQNLLILGAGLFVFGLLVTAVSFGSARGTGAGYTVAFMPIMVGAYTFVRAWNTDVE